MKKGFLCSPAAQQKEAEKVEEEVTGDKVVVKEDSISWAKYLGDVHLFTNRLCEKKDGKPDKIRSNICL